MQNINVLEIIKKEITRQRHPAERRNPTFYPSSASVKLPNGDVLGGCWRADWYRIHGIQATDNASLYMHFTWAYGHTAEALLTDAMKCAGVYENSDVRFFDQKYNISGKLDIVGRYRTSDRSIRYYGVECKSVYGMGVSKTIRGRATKWRGQEPFDPRPKEGNLMQTMIYLDQFSRDQSPQYHLDFFKLIYVPRDKPNDGREFTVTLVTRDDLDSNLLGKFGAEMKEGKRYALIQTGPMYPSKKFPEGKPIPDHIETRFSLEDIYDRFLEELDMVQNHKIPPRPQNFKPFFSAEEIEERRASDDISKSAYEAWVKAGKPATSLDKTPGHFLCQGYCDYRSFCYTKAGKPKKAADKVGLVQLSEPKETGNDRTEQQDPHFKEEGTPKEEEG